MSKWGKVLSWAVGATLVASVAWAATYWKVDSYGNIKAARSSVLLSAGDSSNCRLSISGSTLSVVGHNGNALSASNPCVVGIMSGANEGTVDTVSFTSPVSVTFGAASDTDGNAFGVSSAVNWSERLPFIIGVTSNGTDHYFTISRKPQAGTSSNVAYLCQKGDTDCDGVNDRMILATGLTLNDWLGLPITPVGWFEATYAAAGEAWTFYDDTQSYKVISGFNRLWFTRIFIYPHSQNGAKANSHFSTANAPVPGGTLTYYYSMGIFGELFAYYKSGTNPTNGGDGNAATLTIPFYAESCSGSFSGVSGGGASRGTIQNSSTTPTTVYLLKTSGAYWANSEFSNANDIVTQANIICR